MFPRFYKPLKGRSFFLFGPRGTGKTTWLKEQFPSSQRIDLLHSETARLLLSGPERLEGLIDLQKKTLPIVIDEVQKVPALLDEVHRLIQDQKLDFILTGSSARKLRRGGANLLAGRAYQRFFFPLTCWEIGDEFSVSKALERGLLPGAWNASDPREFLSAYVYTYLKEEVFAEGLTRSLETFSRFLEIASFSQAQVLSRAGIAQDVGTDVHLIASYLEILEDLLLAVRLPVFNKRAKRRMTAHPKFFYFDAGVYRALRPRGPLDTPEEIDGAALETLFLQHHRALGEFVKWDQELFFWRTSNRAEVDFISYGSAGIFAFEIKRSHQVRTADLHSLQLFQQDYPKARCFLFYGGKEQKRIDGIDVIPFEMGLSRLPEIFGVPLL